jgi:hypothetical protein
VRTAPEEYLSELRSPNPDRLTLNDRARMFASALNDMGEVCGRIDSEAVIGALINTDLMLARGHGLLDSVCQYDAHQAKKAS